VNPHRVVGAVVSILVIALTAAPALRDPVKGDDFPLSTYPMFAYKRGTKHSFEYAIGWTATNERRTIKPRHVANNEVMQARTTFSTAVSKRTLPQLCERIAGRVAKDRALEDVVRIEIVRGTHDAVGYLVRGERGRENKLHECRVPR
jgi:hypothetical protein